MRVGVRTCFYAPQVATLLDQPDDPIMEELLYLEPILGFSDSAVSVERSTGKLWVDLVVEAPNLDAAVRMALGYVDTALRKAGLLAGAEQRSLEAAVA